MGLQPSDIRVLYSTLSGSAGYTLPQTDPAQSRGKYASTSEVPDLTLNNLFPDLSAAQNLAGVSLYSCVFCYNANPSYDASNGILYLLSETASGLLFAMGLDPVGVVPIGQSGAQATTITDQLTAPTGVTFSAPTTEATALAVGSVPAGSGLAVWVRVTGDNTLRIPLDTGKLRFRFSDPI